MAANRQGLQTTSNNITNANTPGYSRQRVELQSNAQAYSGNRLSGGGVDVKGVIRIHDSFVQKQIVDESKAFGNYKARATEMRRLEDQLTNNEGELRGSLTKFFSDVRELSASPEISATKSLVLHSAESVAGAFRRSSENLENLGKGIDERISYELKQVNGLTKELATLNTSISVAMHSDRNANELLDQRDLVLKNLSEKIGYDMMSDDAGNINVVVSGIGVLVQGGGSYNFDCQRTEANDSKRAGSVDIFLRNLSTDHKATPFIKEGILGGLLHVRDAVMRPAMDHLDKVAFQFGTSVNEVHRRGVGTDGVGDRELFKITDTANSAAAMIGLNDKIGNSAMAIAAGESGSSGDNRVALMMSDLENAKLVGDPYLSARDGVNDQTFNESLNAMVGFVGVEAQSMDQMYQQHESILGQLNQYRENVSGVSLEEEAIRLMQYQTAFQAAAKSLRIGDEILQTILSLKD